MVHTGGHEVTSAVGSYDISKGVRVGLTPQLRDELIVHEVLQSNSVNTTTSRSNVELHKALTVP